MLSGSLQKQRSIGVVLSAMLVAAWTAAASAEESGHWKGKGVLVVTSQPTVKVADQSDHQLMLREFDGIVFNEGDKPFLENARYQVVDLNDSGGMVSGGYKTFTADDGSQVFARYKMTGGAPPTFNGEWTFVGGTQKYKGISGSGTYQITWIGDTAASDLPKETTSFHRHVHYTLDDGERNLAVIFPPAESTRYPAAPPAGSQFRILPRAPN